MDYFMVPEMENLPAPLNMSKKIPYFLYFDHLHLAQSAKVL
jgi:hypothetical protein